MKKVCALIILSFISSTYCPEFSQVAGIGFSQIVEVGSCVLAPLIAHPEISISSALYAATIIGAAIILDEKNHQKSTDTEKNKNLSIAKKLALCAATAAWHSILFTHTYVWYNK